MINITIYYLSGESQNFPNIKKSQINNTISLFIGLDQVMSIVITKIPKNEIV